MKRVHITNDNFVFHVLTETEAKHALNFTTVYGLYDDDSESELNTEAAIEEHIRRGGYVGIEVGFVDDTLNS